jgi:hypothetical protein
MRSSPPAADSGPAAGAARRERPPRRALRRTALLAALGAAIFSTLPWAVYAVRPPAVIELAVDPPRRIVSGLYPAEIAPDGRTFAWSRETFSITLPGLDRRVSWRATLHIAASRPDGSTPTLLTTIDGLTASTITLPPGGFVDHVVAIEPRADRRRSTSIGFRVVPAFVPGGDPRELGAQIDRITVAPAGGWPRLALDWRAPLLWGIVAGLLAGLLAAPMSLAAAWLAITALLVALAATAGLGPYAGAAWWPALGAGAGAAVATAALLPRARSGAAAAVLITFTAVAVQLVILLHPDMPLGDALFHAHRFQDVRAGKYFFTSVAPGDYQFPYPVGLYVAAGPLARFTRSALENATMLRIVVVLANAIAAALLYRVVMRWRSGDELSAAGAVAAFHLVPLSFGVIATGNLTNVFSQSMAVISLGLAAELAAARGGGGRRVVVLAPLLLVVVAIALLSHTSTFAMLSVQLGLAGLWLATRRRGHGEDGSSRATGVILVGAAIAAAAIAVAAYYAHFGEVYRDAWARITAETGRATEAAGGRTPYVRLVEAPRWLMAYYGLPMLTLAALGMILAIRGRRRLRREVSVIVAAWLIAAGIFLVVGIVTPVDLRHFYSAVPGAALLAGLALSRLWDRGAWTAAAAVLLGAWALLVCWHEAAGWLARGS